MVKSSSSFQKLSDMLYRYKFFFVLFQPTVQRQSSIWNTIVEKLPTVGRSPCFSIVCELVLNKKVAFVLFYLSKPPNINMDDGPIWQHMARSHGIQLPLLLMLIISHTSFSISQISQTSVISLGLNLILPEKT